ncbi:hypothetical protein BGZ83_006213 [Gryganskiella cystojenkinii]|nr:hypothetical protein BGZ83_006213 [Gryganskiella cystojenkinii]
MTTEKTLAAKTPTAAPAAIAKAMVTTTQPLMKTSKRPELCTRRNWAIPPGLALLQNHASANSPNNTQEIPSPCSSSRSSSLPDQRLLHIIPSSPSILSIPSSPSPSSSPLASPTSTTKTLAAIETLSQRLWAIETQMRRPSFLVSGRRSSILSTLFTSNVISPLSPLGPNNTCFTPVNTQKLELESLKLTLPMPVLPLGWADNHNYSSPRSSIEHRGNKDEQHSSVPETPTTAVEPSPKEEGDVDWRAWHANWTRRRAPKSSKLQKEHQQFLQSQNISNTTGFSALSPLSPMSPASFSTSATTLCSPTFSQPMSGTSTLCSRVASFEALHTNASRKFWQSAAATAAANANATVSSRYHPSSSSSPLKKFITAPANTGSGISAICDHKERGIRKPATSSIKDANPELWEDDQGQKWKDRFQSLVHNFQTSAGKHSRRLADILPKAKSRWGNKRASSQSPSSSSQSQEHRQQHYQEPVVVHKKQAKPLPRVQAAKIWGHS